MEIYLPLAIAVVFALLLAAFWVVRARQHRPDRSRAVVELPGPVAERVDALLADGKYVAAVKEVRVATGAGLQVGVDTVDARKAHLSGADSQR